MPVHHTRCARTVATGLAALAVGFVMVTTARSATAATSCSSTEQLSFTWVRQSPTLASGDTGCAVAEWQSLLNDWLNAAETVGRPAAHAGDRLGVDGVFGARTGDMTRYFQATQFIAVDGVVGPTTRFAYLIAPELIAAGTGPSRDASVLGPGSHGLAVTAWQTALNRWLSRTGSEMGQVAVDGVFGAETERATQAFQAAQGVIVDGLVGPMTRVALVDALALMEPVGSGQRTVVPAEAATPAAGICDRANDEVATILLRPDAPNPRCVVVSSTQRLRVENGPRPATVEFAGWTVDLAPGETATIGPEFGTYLAPGIHTVRVSIYGDGGGPQLWVLG